MATAPIPLPDPEPAPTPAPGRPAHPAGPFRSLGPNVVALGFVSFFTDVASDIAAPILPLYLAGTLHASPVLIGLADAVPEFVAALLKPCSGWIADRTGRRKALAFAGYTLSALTKPLFALALSGWHALAIRSLDRVGKGIRIAPRDALIADSCPPHLRGWAFGFNRAMDHLGGAVGPLVGLALLSLLATDDLRPLFLFTAVPGILTLFVLGTFVRDTRPAALLGRLSDRVGRIPLILAGWAVYAVAYLGFAGATTPAAIWA
ncbi:MAG: MFS transporter, partial [Planctomycetes bacterium]|nr:MFS transporter [Planctomycetota bacterium]